MRVDVRHLPNKGPTKKLIDQIIAYVGTMRDQGKTVDRVIIKPAQYDVLIKQANARSAGAVLCCGDTLVYYSHDPIDETRHYPAARPRYVADLPPVPAASPFGIAPTVPMPVYNINSGFDDDDIPF